MTNPNIVRSETTNPKIDADHLNRVAIVYIRQSTARQVLEHQESTRLQYQLTDRAEHLGWPKDRVVVIDEDLGLSGASAEGRSGFQRLLAEVSLNHVGLVLGIEMSRLARSNKDWHQLLELCGIFRCLLADQDGLYDPCDFNDRLLLGLKGTMSEAELHILRGRMLAGSRNKAKRGELITHLPMGYVKSSSDTIILDPDKEARRTVALVFDKFQELGSANAVLRYFRNNGVLLPIRPFHGPNKGQIEWREALYSTIAQMLRNPTYAGAYTHGRYQQDVRRRHNGSPGAGRYLAEIEDWRVLIHDNFPAYISWPQYVANRAKLKANRVRFDTSGTPRDGRALLAGIVFCGRCGRKMFTHYKATKRSPAYVCQGEHLQRAASMCQRLISWCVDDLARRLVLEAVEPACIELSVEAENSIHAEESDINQQWMNRQRDAERAVSNARRQYEAVDPENRLVAQSLEESWEKSLRHQCEIDEAFERFRSEREIEVTEDDIKLIRSLSQDLPALWLAESTSNADRQLIVRHLISRVSVTIVGQSEVVDVAIEWVGGNRTEHRVFRPVARYDALHDFDALKSRIIELWQEGCTTPTIAEKVNESGFRTPGIRNPYSRSLIRQLLDSWGQTEPLRAQISQNQSQLEKDEWWLVDLAQDLGIANSTLARWCRRGWVNARKLEGKSKWWIAWADKSERTRLKKLFKFSSGGVKNHNPYPPKLVTPKNRK